MADAPPMPDDLPVPDALPAGFVPYAEPSPFLDRVGPLYECMDAGGLRIGLRVLAHHCNRRGFAHGAVLAAVADIALGKSIERLSDPPVSALTSHLAIDFVRPAQRGDWIEARVDFRVTHTRSGLSNVYLRVGDVVIARANAAFAIVPRAAPPPSP